MQSNYEKALQIRIAKHPEWDEDRIWEEVKKIYEHSNNMVYRTGNNIFIVPGKDNKPIEFIYEGGQYEE